MVSSIVVSLITFRLFPSLKYNIEVEGKKKIKNRRRIPFFSLFLLGEKETLVYTMPPVVLAYTCIREGFVWCVCMRARVCVKGEDQVNRKIKRNLVVYGFASECARYGGRCTYERCRRSGRGGYLYSRKCVCVRVYNVRHT